MRKFCALVLMFAAIWFVGCGGGGGGGTTGTTGTSGTGSTGTTGTASTGTTGTTTNTTTGTTSTSSTSSGNNQSSFTIANTPNAMALDGNGHVWVTLVDSTREFDANGNNISSNSLGGSGIAIDASGDPWTASANGLNHIDPATGASTSFPGSNDLATTAGPVAIDVSGNIWAASTITGQVFELNSSGTQQTQFTVIPAPGTPGGLAIDANGNLWVTSNDGFLREASPSGNLMQQINLGGQPANIAIDANGNLWVPDSSSNVVNVISSAGASVGTFTVGNAPGSVAIDHAGNVFVANATDGTISELSSAGATINTISLLPISGSAAAAEPIAISIDASGNIWALDTAFDGVHIVSNAAQGPQFFPYSGPQAPWGSGLNGF